MSSGGKITQLLVLRGTGKVILNRLLTVLAQHKERMDRTQVYPSVTLRCNKHHNTSDRPQEGLVHTRTIHVLRKIIRTLLLTV